jgi:hypothetical protein
MHKVKREMSVNEDGHYSVEKHLGKVLRQIDDCSANCGAKAKGRLDEIEQAQLRMVIVEWAARADHD